jgi:Spy/CpxP family protein refolding chaperone
MAVEIRRLGTCGVALLAIGLSIAVSQWPANVRDTAPVCATRETELEALPDRGELERLDLDAAQRTQIERLRARAQRRVAAIAAVLGATELELRRQEVAVPFNARRVNALVVRQAQLIAHLRRTQSRVVGQIAQLLTAEQQRRFAALRAAEPRESLPPAPPPKPTREFPV